MERRNGSFLITIICSVLVSLFSECQIIPTDPLSEQPQQNQTKIDVEINPGDISADVYCITIDIDSLNQVKYFEPVTGNFISVAVPSDTSCVVTIDAFKGNVFTHSGSRPVSTSDRGLLKITLSPVYKPAVPSAVTTTLVTDPSNQILLTWQPDTLAKLFLIYRAQDTESVPDNIGYTVEPLYSDINVEEGVTYFYRIVASNDVGESAPSDYVSVTFQTAPMAPANLSAVAVSSSEITITFDASIGATDYIVLGGNSATDLSPLDTITTQTFAHTGLTELTDYYYSVTAFNAEGVSPSSDTVSAKTFAAVPSLPSNVAANATSPSSITITWNAVSGATGYTIYRQSQSSTTPQKIKTNAVSPYIDSALSSQSTWGYSVSAVNSAGESDMTNPVWATTLLTKPATPQGVILLVLSEKSIQATWPAMERATTYKVEWATVSTGPYTVAIADSNTYIIGGLAVATKYYVRVCAVNSAGQSAPSGIVSATTLTKAALPPVAPVISVAVSSDTSLTISWPAVTGASTYIIERTSPTKAACTTSALSWIDKKLIPNTLYTYRAKAVNTSGASAYSANASATTAAKVVVLLPPSNLAKGTITSTSVSLTWQAATGAASYKIYRSMTETGQYTSVGTSTGLSYTDTSLTPVTTYYYKVSSVNSTTESAQSAALPATTSAGQAQPPAQPSTPTATAASSTGINVTWSAVPGTGISYIVFGGKVSASIVPLDTITTTSFSHTGLTAATTYYYAVAAKNPGGTSAKSTTVSATTKAASTGPAAPINVKATAKSSTSILITFSLVPNATYKIYRSTSATGTFAKVGASTDGTHTDASGLSANTTYYYYVTAIVANVESDPSTKVNATTSAAGVDTGKNAVIDAAKCSLHLCNDCYPCPGGQGAISKVPYPLNRKYTYVVDPDKCIGCGKCIPKCAWDDIKLQ